MVFVVPDGDEWFIEKGNLYLLTRNDMDLDFDMTDAAPILQTIDPDLPWTWSFVLTALHIPHRVVHEDGVFFLVVPTEHRAQALQELNEFFLETTESHPEYEDIRQAEGATLNPPTVILIGSLILLYVVTGPWKADSIWFQKGAGDSGAILQHGAWFRLITALTLHANPIHLLNNCAFGGLLLHFYLIQVGTGVGLFALLLAATAGNGIDVLLHGPGHIFVGFSTAIFAVIGMLAMLRYKDESSGFRPRLYVPLMGAFALLAFIGSAGKNTDLGAHLFGLLCGLLMGRILVLPVVKRLRRSFVAQTLFFVVSLAIFVVSWVLALTR